MTRIPDFSVVIRQVRKTDPTGGEASFLRTGRISTKTIQNNIRELERASLVQRELRKTAAGDWNSNIYHLDGLVKKVQALEPEFTAERKKRQAAKAALETPAGLRKAT